MLARITRGLAALGLAALAALATTLALDGLVARLDLGHRPRRNAAGADLSDVRRPRVPPERWREVLPALADAYGRRDDVAARLPALDAAPPFVDLLAGVRRHADAALYFPALPQPPARANSAASAATASTAASAWSAVAAGR